MNAGLGDYCRLLSYLPRTARKKRAELLGILDGPPVAQAGTGEVSLLRRLWGLFRAGDVVLTDSLLSSWAELMMLKQRGIDSVSRLNKARRSADFRRGKRLSKDDHIVTWPKPMKPRTMDKETYDALPDSLSVREVRVKIEKRGFRTKN